MKPRDERVCDATTRTHADGETLVTFLMGQNGSTKLSQSEVAGRLDFWKDRGGGVRQVDRGRFNRAKNHVRDRVDENGKPCCGYTIHYRRSGSESVLALVDPSGDLGAHAEAAVATIRGWVSRENQHLTENRRHIETMELLANHTLARRDREGYRVLQRAIIDVERDGTVSADTMADLNVWLAAL